MIEIQKRSKQKYIIIFLLILIFCTTFFIMYRYHIEGEKNLPFQITKMIVVSSAKTEDLEVNENTYQANVIQKNDIYIAIEKNKDYDKEEAIKRVVFNNFKIVEQGKKGSAKFYRTSQKENEFEYTKKYEIEESVIYSGAKETNLNIENMTISNQGGLIELSFIIDDLGKITYSENDNIVTDGSLLKLLNLTNEDIKYKISFDMSIELVGDKNFKTTIFLEMPADDIINKGVTTDEKNDLSELIFKRT